MTSLSAERNAARPELRPGVDVGSAVRFARLGHLQACGLLILLAVSAFLPGFASLQPMDRDEPRFAQASKQMLETGDFVDIRFQGEARHKKPVGIYWLQSATVATADALGVSQARTTIALYRLPSLLGAVAAVLLTYWAALAFVGRVEAFWAAALIASSVILGFEARLAKTDAVLAACAVAAMGALARAYLGRRGPLPWRTALVFWTALALGILIKGPMVPLFAGLAALTLSMRDRSPGWLLRLRPGPGLALTALLVAPWFLAIALKSRGAFFAEAVGHDMLGKVGTAQTQHWAPPGAYLLAFFGTFWPGAALAAIAAPFAWRERRDDAVAFLLAWILPAWLLLELVPTKLPHYVMPLYPPIAILTLLAVARGFVRPERPGAKATALLIALVPVGLAAALVFAAWSLDRAILPWQALLLLGAAVALSFAAWAVFVRGEVRTALGVASLAAVALGAGIFGFAQTTLASLKVSPRLAAAVRAMACSEPKAATLGYREPSLVFLLGTDLQLLDGPREAAQFLGGGGCRVALVEQRFGAAFEEAARDAALAPVVLSRVSGFNINGGRRLDIAAYAVLP